MVVTCDIQFENNPDGCYYAGQVISGKITLSSDKVKQVKAVILKIKGFAHNQWSESESNGDSTTYTGHVDYIDTVTGLLTSAHNDESISIQPGIHCFNFVCHIPTTCPSSFEGHSGHIRYLVMVCLLRPWKFDTKFTRGFTVLQIMNLNCESPLLKMPVSQHIHKEFCCGPLKSDPLEMLLQLPRSGFVPGENIPVGVLVTNDSNAKIKEIRLRLVMMVCLYSQLRANTRNEHTTVSKLLGDPVLPLCKKVFNYLLPVPATPPTCMTACSITQISYRVEVEAKIKGAFYRNQVIHTEVTIGNVPISNVIQMQPSFSRGGMLTCEVTDEIDSAVVTQRFCNVSNVQPWSENDDTPPPLYMETSYMPPAVLAAAGEHEYGEKKFSPRYPVYNMSSSSTETQISDNLESVTATKTATETNKSTWL